MSLYTFRTFKACGGDSKVAFTISLATYKSPVPHQVQFDTSGIAQLAFGKEDFRTLAALLRDAANALEDAASQDDESA